MSADAETLNKPDADSAPPAPPAALVENTNSKSAFAVPGFTASDRWFLTVVCAAILAIIAAQWIASLFTSQPLVELRRLPAREFEFQIDVNTATWVEWMQLPGLGETLARQIVADRETQGPFATIDDVARVRGIGPVRMRDMLPYLKIGAGRDDGETMQAESAPP